MLLPIVTKVTGGSSPHTRGARGLGGALRGPQRIIPAYAGSTLATECVLCSQWDHPRIRGEHEARASDAGELRGSSPHTRGAPTQTNPARKHTGIIPAYAGSTRPVKMPPKLRTDHPRIRGEHGQIGHREHDVLGSSPHTRGAPSVGCPPMAAPADHPRIRGEHTPRRSR